MDWNQIAISSQPSGSVAAGFADPDTVDFRPFTLERGMFGRLLAGGRFNF